LTGWLWCRVFGDGFFVEHDFSGNGAGVFLPDVPLTSALPIRDKTPDLVPLGLVDYLGGVGSAGGAGGVGEGIEGTGGISRFG
jgi:hypothetical protein